MSRVQLALNVADIDSAVEFYSKLFRDRASQTSPSLRKLRYRRAAAQACAHREPVGRGKGVTGALNHLGVEVETPGEVRSATSRLSSEGLDPRLEESTTCCYAVQDKAWVTDPDGAPWEVYTVLADAPVESGIAGDDKCCTPADSTAVADPVIQESAACC